MLKGVFSLWGYPVQNMLAHCRITCGEPSTIGDHLTKRYTIHPHVTHLSPVQPALYPRHLFTPFYLLSPLMNTFFTQFPQTLLLRRRNEI